MTRAAREAAKQLAADAIELTTIAPTKVVTNNIKLPNKLYGIVKRLTEWDLVEYSVDNGRINNVTILATDIPAIVRNKFNLIIYQSE